MRFWFKPSRGRLVFKNWAVVTDRTTIFEHDQDDNSAERILWFLAEVGSPNVRDWPVEVIESEVLDLPEKEKPIARNPEKLLARYSQLSQILSQEASESVVAQKTRRTFKRRKDARDLVIARSGEMCENTSCTGMPKDTDKNGRALLEVDHIKPLGEGGPDIPSNMIALCPNCHVAKTRGIRAAAMSKELKKIVEAKEIDLLKA
jgi:5-methylcytosine-specific restriction protein A